MKTLLSLLFLLGLVACGGDPIRPLRWNMAHKAMTAEEHARIDAHVREVLSHVPQSLSGHDQDIDDYAREVYRGATETLTPPRMFEEEERNEMWHETGRWRPVEGPGAK